MLGTRFPARAKCNGWVCQEEGQTLSLTAFSISADYMNINQGRSEKNVNLQRKHCQEQVAGWRNAGLIWLCDYHGTRTIYSQNLIILQWEMGIRNWQNSHQKAEVAKSDKAWAALKWRRPSNFPGGIGSSDLAKKPSGAGPPLACLLPNRTDPSIYLHQIFPQSKHYQGNSSYRSARGLGDILLRVRAWTIILADQETGFNGAHIYTPVIKSTGMSKIILDLRQFLVVWTCLKNNILPKCMAFGVGEWRGLLPFSFPGSRVACMHTY